MCFSASGTVAPAPPALFGCSCISCRFSSVVAGMHRGVPGEVPKTKRHRVDEESLETGDRSGPPSSARAKVSIYEHLLESGGMGRPPSGCNSPSVVGKLKKFGKAASFAQCIGFLNLSNVLQSVAAGSLKSPNHVRPQYFARSAETREPTARLLSQASSQYCNAVLLLRFSNHQYGRPWAAVIALPMLPYREARSRRDF